MPCFRPGRASSILATRSILNQLTDLNVRKFLFYIKFKRFSYYRYVRISTDNQRDNGYSIDSQPRMIKEYNEYVFI